MQEKIKIALSVVGFIILFTTIGVLVASGLLQSWAISIGQLGIWAHLIFVLFFFQTGLPFGWGYAMFIQIVGFVFGWFGLVTAEIGMLCGGIAGFFTSRYCLRNWALRKIETFPVERRRIVDEARNTLSQGGRSVLFFSVIRNTPALTFGWVNGLCGALTDMSLSLYILTLILGTQADLCLNIFIGTVARELATYNTADSKKAGNFTSTQNSTRNSTIISVAGNVQNLEQTVLTIQILLAVLLFVASTIWSRWLLKNMISSNNAKVNDAGPIQSSCTGTKVHVHNQPEQNE
jgi:uncharacterized membrane protein YdjX (TVP38/TMEM64 family)